MRTSFCYRKTLTKCKFGVILISDVCFSKSKCNLSVDFVRFDVIASSSEEARNPQKDIPIALAISLIVVTVSYVGVSAILTLMVPW